MTKRTNTESVPINMMGLRPYLSAAIPQRIDVKALPTINEEPEDRNSQSRTIQLIFNSEIQI